jgi:hypothetical protein
MHRNFAAIATLFSVMSFYPGCAGEEPTTSGKGGSGGGGAVAGASMGGSAGAASGSGGTSGTAGDTSGASGASGASGSAGSGGSVTGGASGSGGDAGAGMTGGAGGAGAGGAGPGGAGAGGAGPGGAGASGGGGAGASGAGGGGAGGGGGANSMMNFFVTSSTSTTGNLGGLAMADMRCQTLAAAVGQGSKTWRAYLSVANPTMNAIDRIGNGPYYNSMGAMVATDKAALHARNGDPALFIDERGGRVNGQWQGSPTPNQHDVLTGSTRAGMLQTDATCGDWMSTEGDAQVGHSDGMGPNMSTTGNLAYWNSSHTAPCDDLASTGGAGKLYCFVAP